MSPFVKQARGTLHPAPLLLATILVFVSLLARAEEEPINLECMWAGQAPSEWALLELQLDHGKWLQDKRIGRQAVLCKANLNGVDLSGFNFENANFSGASLLGAILDKTIFKGADLRSADLQGANLSNADLAGANLSGANLSNAKLLSTNLKDAIFANVNLTSALYQPLSTPAASYLGGLQGLESLNFEDKGNHQAQSAGLVLLRTQLRKAGLQNLERQATRSIERHENEFRSPPQQLTHMLLFDWTSEYGTNPSLILRRLASVIFIFALIYMLPLSKGGWGGIHITPIGDFEEVETPLIPRGLGILGNGILFSLSSAVGFAGARLSFGRWVSRIQGQEHFFRAREITRLLSGLQTTLCLYLLSLWFLTLFARPFG